MMYSFRLPAPPEQSPLHTALSTFQASVGNNSAEDYFKHQSPHDYQFATHKSPSRKTHEPDHRASHFYLGMYWAEALVAQDQDAALKEQCGPLAKSLAESEEQITKELEEIQGEPVDLGGYYHPDVGTTAAAMCRSKTLNEILAE